MYEDVYSRVKRSPRKTHAAQSSPPVVAATHSRSHRVDWESRRRQWLRRQRRPGVRRALEAGSGVATRLVASGPQMAEERLREGSCVQTRCARDTRAQTQPQCTRCWLRPVPPAWQKILVKWSTTTVIDKRLEIRSYPLWAYNAYKGINHIFYLYSYPESNTCGKKDAHCWNPGAALDPCRKSVISYSWFVIVWG